jgi:hypothetical protein
VAFIGRSFGARATATAYSGVMLRISSLLLVGSVFLLACPNEVAAPIAVRGPGDDAKLPPGEEAPGDGDGDDDDDDGINQGDLDAEEPIICAGPARSGALRFDGVDDHVTMGLAPELGLERFTVEAWVRRDGRGKAAGTGVGGLQLVPIAGKGRGENDDTTKNCNYAFGFTGDVLGADFEDMATGANHPVTGATAVPLGEWHHVAATFDGAAWRLYLDGALDGEAATAAVPRGDSIQHFGIGALFDSTGAPAGALNGAIDEVRVWDHARSADEIADAMYTASPSGVGLVGHWSLDDDGSDALGSNDGTIGGAVHEADSAALDVGLPPAAAPSTPAPEAALAADAVTLSLQASDLDGDELTVTYYLRELSVADDFTIVVLPDTQYYTVASKGFEQFFYDQTQWVRDNRGAYNIVGVIHNGDITDQGDTAGYASQWTVASRAMATLETPEPDLVDGVPYGVSVGNHDNKGGTTTRYNEHFGVPRFEGRSYYGGHYGSDNDESWFTFSAGSLDFVVVNLQYDTSPDAAVLAWARSIFEMHPDAFGILNTHFILNSGGEFGAQGQAIYDALKDVPNVQLMTCGHVSAESRRSDDHAGHTIHSMLADYQFLYRDTPDYRGGSGYLRIWEFSPANDELTVRTYSPSLDTWQTDANSEFTLPVNLRGGGGAFREVATVQRASLGTDVTLEGLAPGKTYEWYASVRDCEHETTTAITRFTTTP